MTYVVTTLKRVTYEVQMARQNCEISQARQGRGHAFDPGKVGYGIQSPVVKDNAGKEYLCELVETHYNQERDELIFVWKPMIAVDELPDELRNVPDHNPLSPLPGYAGEQDPED